MKLVMVIVDGMTDVPSAVLGGKTPLAYANCQNLKLMHERGGRGVLETCPEGFAVESLPCILTLLGVSPAQIPNGRAYMESVAAGITTKPEDLFFRCNLVEEKNGVLVSSCAQSLTAAEQLWAAQRVAEECGEGFALHPLSSYKNLLIAKGRREEWGETQTFPPHENLGSPILELLPRGGVLGKELADFCLHSREILKGVFGERGRYLFLPWGQSVETRLPSFAELHGLSCGAVCATEIVKGLALSMGFAVPEVAGATADVDTDLSAKAEMAVSLLHSCEFVLVHVNGADEASHRRTPAQKAAFLKRVDEELLGELLRCAGEDVSYLVCADHTTRSDTGAHEAGGQPFVLYNRKKREMQELGCFPGREAVKLLMKY